jgi:hypothetical protein
LACASSDVAVGLMLKNLEPAVRNWSKIAKPIQLSMKARGITHQHSETIGYAIRSLGVDLFNKHDLMAQSERTIRLVQEFFSDLPEIIELVQDDVNTLNRLKREASEKIETQRSLQKQQDTFKKIIASTLACASSAVAVDLMLNDLETALLNWSKIVKPIQLIIKTQGIAKEHSEEIGYAIRSLGIDLFNKHDLMAQSERTMKLVQRHFSDFPEIIKMVQVDVTTLARLKKEASEASRRNVEWEREITYSAEIGLVFKDTLSISPNGIAWKNSTYPLDTINGVRWGGIKKSVNGIPTGTDYTIAFGNSRTSSVVSLNREAVYSKFTDCLWRAVCVRLLIEMGKSLKNGAILTFGDMNVRDDAFQLQRHKFLSSNEFLWNSLDSVTYSSSNGTLLISSKTDKKMYGASSYIDHWNTHILEHLVRGAFKKGCRRLSDYLEN